MTHCMFEEDLRIRDKPQTSNPKPQTPNPKPQTPNLKPQTIDHIASHIFRTTKHAGIVLMFQSFRKRGSHPLVRHYFLKTYFSLCMICILYKQMNCAAKHAASATRLFNFKS